MFDTNYYCLVAGLREYSLDGGAKGFDPHAILDEILRELTPRDLRAVRLLYGYYDCKNLIALRAGSPAHDPLGNFARERLKVDWHVVGNDDVAEQLRRSSASDFGLRGELPYIDAVIAAVNDESNLLEKEHKIDRIRWQQAVDLAAEDYFNVNAVLSYLVRINLVARWTQLDEARGRAMLGRLLRELDGKELINNK